MASEVRSRMLQLGDYVSSARFAALPDEVVWRAKMITLDNLGCALLGSSLPGSAAAVLSADVLGSGSEATIALKPAGESSVFAAALVNSTYIGNTDLSEGVSRGVVHPGGVLVPSALADAERLHAAGEDYLLALVTGYDVVVRMGWALAHEPGAPIGEGKPKTMQRGFFGPGLLGAFGSATASAVLNKLEPAVYEQAMGICGSLLPNALIAAFKQGAQVKGLSYGWAGALGIYSGRLAERGFTGLEGVENSLFPILVDNPDYSLILDRLGERYEILDVDTKFFAAGPVRSEVECGLALRARYDFDVADIAGIRIESGGRSSTLDDPEPANLLAGKFSVPYCVAQTLLGRTQPEMMAEAFTDEAFGDPQWRPIARLCRIELNEEFDRDFETFPQLRRPARITLEMRDGSQLQELCEHPRGLQATPPGEEDYLAKFRYLAGRLLPPERVERIVDLVLRLDKVDDAGELSRAIGA